MKLLLPMLLTAAQFVAAGNAIAAAADWEAGREEILSEAIQELRQTPQLKYWPASTLTFFAKCTVEKRIQMAKAGNCSYRLAPGTDIQSHITQQMACFDRVGYGKQQRKMHGEFCMSLLNWTK